VTIWDRGTYECEKWSDDEVMVHLHGDRATGRYVLIHTDGKNWLMHRMRGQDPVDSEGTPRKIAPMLATLGDLPARDEDYGYETKWDGVRAVAYVDGSTVRLLTRNDLDVTVAYPELAGLADAIGVRPLWTVRSSPTTGTGKVSFGALQQRMHLRNRAQIERAAAEVPVTYCVFDLLWIDGHRTTGLPYEKRRELLLALDLNGPHWTTPPHHRGGGAKALATARRLGVEGIVAKRLDSVYEPGRRSKAVDQGEERGHPGGGGGWLAAGPGLAGGTVGSLLLGIPSRTGLRYAGQVGTGFTREILADLQRRLKSLARRRPRSPTAAHRRCQGRTVGDAEAGGGGGLHEWTRDGRLRHPAWRGLRRTRRHGRGPRVLSRGFRRRRQLRPDTVVSITLATSPPTLTLP
jgi:bifunctional non-homologous end joining protein LigD